MNAAVVEFICQSIILGFGDFFFSFRSCAMYFYGFVDCVGGWNSKQRSGDKRISCCSLKISIFVIEFFFLLNANLKIWDFGYFLRVNQFRSLVIQIFLCEEIDSNCNLNYFVSRNDWLLMDVSLTTGDNMKLNFLSGRFT